jgi:hypothetical protein
MFLLIACTFNKLLDLKNGNKNLNFPKKENLEVFGTMGTLQIGIKAKFFIFVATRYVTTPFVPWSTRLCCDLKFQV